MLARFSATDHTVCSSAAQRANLRLGIRVRESRPTDLSAERSLTHARHHPHIVAIGNSSCEDGTVRRRGSTPTVWPVSFVEAEARLGIRIAEGPVHAQRTGLLV